MTINELIKDNNALSKQLLELLQNLKLAILSEGEELGDGRIQGNIPDYLSYTNSNLKQSLDIVSKLLHEFEEEH